jgi:hypothetical protein
VVDKGTLISPLPYQIPLVRQYYMTTKKQKIRIGLLKFYNFYYFNGDKFSGWVLTSNYAFCFWYIRVEALLDGDYRMCWDNTFSHFNSKTVFFELTIESPENDNDPWNFELDEGFAPNKVYEMTVQDIQVKDSNLTFSTS